MAINSKAPITANKAITPVQTRKGSASASQAIMAIKTRTKRKQAQNRQE